MNVKKTSLLVLLAGIATFSSMIVMMLMAGEMKTLPAEYPNSQGFTQAIFFFELAESTEEIEQVLGNPADPKGIRIRRTMDTLNRYDFIFMICYPLLYAALTVFLLSLLAQRGIALPYSRILAAAGLVLAITMMGSDIYENMQLLRISAAPSISDISQMLMLALKVSTRIKSAAISLGGLVLAHLYFRHFRKSWGIILPIIYGATALLGLAVIFVSQARFLIEPVASVGFICWLVSTIHGGVWFFRSRRTPSIANT